MPSYQDDFIAASQVKTADPEHRRKLLFNITQYDKKVVEGKKQYSNLELARRRAAVLKWRSIENLEKYLQEFETNFTRRGGKVIWAQDETEAIREINSILKRAGVTRVVKSKSMITEEIHLNHHLQKENIESIETDLGEYIVQQRNEPPYHIVTPAMHLSKEDVAKTFHEKFNLPAGSTPKEIVGFVRTHLRERYMDAGAGITGANFLVADSGAVVVTENEGNAMMSVSFPKIHIAIAGLEKIIPSLTDLDLFLPLLATHGTGQNMTVYNSLFSGPRFQKEEDGPEDMYVILLDNGRTDLLAKENQRQALSCIRCGACLNACPVYQNVGGHAYGTTYSGPIGSVITPHLRSMKDFRHLSFASSLCGRCTEVCPVKIDVHKLLLYNRSDSVAEGLAPRSERWIFFFWKKAMLNRETMNKGGAKAKNFILRNFFQKSWGTRRELPRIAPRSFNQMWRDEHPD